MADHGGVTPVREVRQEPRDAVAVLRSEGQVVNAVADSVLAVVARAEFKGPRPYGTAILGQPHLDGTVVPQAGDDAVGQVDIGAVTAVQDELAASQRRGAENLAICPPDGVRSAGAHYDCNVNNLHRS